MNERETWLRDWCAQNIEYHRSGKFSQHCRYCKAELRISLELDSPDIQTVFRPLRTLQDTGRIARVVGVIFPALAPKEAEISIDLLGFPVQNDDTDGSRLYEFLIESIAKFAPEKGPSES